jgi:NitT/TauT family transport system substrate-binding protein
MALLFVSSACGGATSASSTPVTSTLQKITVSFSSVSYAQIATPVAQETGVFAKNGLDANLVLGPNGIPGLLSGEIQVLTGSPEETILAAAGGADLEIVAVVVPFMQHEFMVRPEIKTMADLKGKGIGVSKRGTITDVVVRMAAQRGGLDPDHDLTMVELGTNDKIVAALAAGSVSGAPFTPPNTDIVRAQGGHTLYNFREEHIPLASNAVVVKRQWAQNNKNTLLAFLRSQAEAVQMVRTQPDVVASVYAKWAKSGDDAAKAAVAQAAQAVPVKMTPDLEGVKAVQDSVASINPLAGQIDTARLMDDSYIKQLEAEGFYAKLGV